MDAAAQHPCFSGVFDRGNEIQLYGVQAQGPVTLLDFQCEDCLRFRLACRADALPPGVTHYQAAELLTQHVRSHRGYRLSVGGYHTAISEWLSAVYWDAAGLFALHSDRGTGAGKPALDVLIHALQKGLIRPLHPAMLDPQQYRTQEVFLSVVPPPSVTSMATLLGSSHVATGWKPGYSRVTLAEFLPIAAQASAGPAAGAAQPAASATSANAAAVNVAAANAVAANAAAANAAPVVRQVGQACPECGEIIGERWLLTSTYIGCRCG